MAVMMVTGLTVVEDFPGKICFSKLYDISATAAHDFDMLGFEDILGSLPHVAGEHYGHSHLSQHRGDPALAPAPLRRGQLVL